MVRRKESLERFAKESGNVAKNSQNFGPVKTFVRTMTVKSILSQERITHLARNDGRRKEVLKQTMNEEFRSIREENGVCKS